MNKHNQAPTLDTTQDVELTIEHPDFLDQATPFVVKGNYEAVQPILSSLESAVPRKPVKVPVAVLEPPTQPENGSHVNLADLDSRTLARMSLKALRHDVLTLGRTSLYKQFKAKLHEEVDLQAMTELHIVESVHCRLHERQIARARGLV